MNGLASDCAGRCKHRARNIETVKAAEFGWECDESLLDGTLDRLGLDIDVKIYTANLDIPLSRVVFDIKDVFRSMSKIGRRLYIGVLVFTRRGEFLTVDVST